MMQKNFYLYFLQCSVLKFVISRYLWFAGEKMWFIKARVRYTEGSLYRNDLQDFP